MGYASLSGIKERLIECQACPFDLACVHEPVWANQGANRCPIYWLDDADHVATIAGCEEDEKVQSADFVDRCQLRFELRPRQAFARADLDTGRGAMSLNM